METLQVQELRELQREFLQAVPGEVDDAQTLHGRELLGQRGVVEAVVTGGEGSEPAQQRDLSRHVGHSVIGDVECD